MKHLALRFILALAIFLAVLGAAQAQTTAFTYQGRLNVSGSPANGVYDFTFQAFDAATAGSSIGGSVNVNAIGVTNGLFTAVVDLGATPFTGPARWLQIAVSTNGAGSYSTLSPRQKLTPTPYAIYANTAGTVTNGGIANAQLAASAVAAGNIQNSTITAGKIASGQVVKSLNGLTDAVSLTQGANVTITTVGNGLQISAPAGGLALPYSGTASSSGTLFTLNNTGSGHAADFTGPVSVREGRFAISGSSVTLDPTMVIVNNVGKELSLTVGQSTSGTAWYVAPNAGTIGVDTGMDLRLSAGAAERMRIASTGNVGIGTTTPGAPLHIQGSQAYERLVSTNTLNGSVLEMWNTTTHLIDGPPVTLGAINFGDGSTTPGQISYTVAGSHHMAFRVGGVDNMMSLSTSGLSVNGTFVSSSDRNVKENFKPVDARQVLDKVTALPVTRWNYKQDTASEHIGPMAQDFYAAFNVGPDDKHITTIDESGVALAAIQGLNQKVEDMNGELKRRDTENAELKQRLERLEQLMRDQNGGAK